MHDCEGTREECLDCGSESSAEGNVKANWYDVCDGSVAAVLHGLL